MTGIRYTQGAIRFEISASFINAPAGEFYIFQREYFDGVSLLNS